MTATLQPSRGDIPRRANGVTQSRTKSEVVSSTSEQLILVNSDDEEIGTLDKDSCHDGEGRLHRAFSLFIFNSDGKLLMQQRHPSKRLWPMSRTNYPKQLLPLNGPQSLLQQTAKRLSDNER